MILLLKSYPYHFVRTILSVPFCPIPFCPYTILSIPFCPYHFVRYHFVLEPGGRLYMECVINYRLLRNAEKEQKSLFCWKVTFLMSTYLWRNQMMRQSNYSLQSLRSVLPSYHILQQFLLSKQRPLQMIMFLWPTETRTSNKKKLYLDLERNRPWRMLISCSWF